MSSLSGKVALVTGAASGIGQATARRFAQEGAQVVLADLNEDGVRDVAASIGDVALPVAFDAGDPDTIRAAVDAAVDAFGGLDVLHNNVALTSPDVMTGDTNAVDIDLDLWDRVMAVNVRGYLVGCKYAIPAMAERGGGSIICTASGAAQAGDVTRIAYGCSKGAIVTMVKYVATQHAHQGIRCNAIAPGLVKTPALYALAPELIDLLGRHILTDHVEAEDIAEMAAYLASDASRRVTGQTINVDGGYYSHQPSYADFAATMAPAA
ncbi:MAG: short-chain dehydrogenase [Conexibacter sp.]|nr:short-chain dehydrogenase [Conexibacter sp.]